MPRVSIITINYNNTDGLQRTIESVKSQNYSDMEYIVVDGGSTDKSVDIIKENEAFINKWVSEEDKGIYNALNKGIKMATGDYLLFLNSGDHFYNSYVLINNEHHINTEDLIAFDIHVLGQGFNQINRHPDQIRFSFLFEDTLAHQAVFFKRNLFRKVGLFDETLKIVADWNFFIHAIVLYNCTYKPVHEILSTYYLDGISSSAEGTYLRKKEREQILNEKFFLFYDDYKNAKKNQELLLMNRFKMLQQLEKSYFGRKLSSFALRILTFFIK